METIKELGNFKDILYIDEGHSYYADNRRLTSVTTLIGKFSQGFQASYWANKKAKEYNVSADSVLYAWQFLNDLSTFKGIALHKYAENLWEGKVFKQDNSKILENFGYNPLESAIKKIKAQYIDFYTDYKDILVPLKAEMVVGDPELGVAGMFDRLFYDKITSTIPLYDWKTEKEFNMNGEGYIKYMKKPLSHLQDNQFNQHALQLSTYRYLLERRTGLQVGELVIGWFFEGNEKYKLIKLPYLKDEVEAMIGEYLIK